MRSKKLLLGWLARSGDWDQRSCERDPELVCASRTLPGSRDRAAAGDPAPPVRPILHGERPSESRGPGWVIQGGRNLGDHGGEEHEGDAGDQHRGCGDVAAPAAGDGPVGRRLQRPHERRQNEGHPAGPGRCNLQLHAARRKFLIFLSSSESRAVRYRLASPENDSDMQACSLQHAAWPATLMKAGSCVVRASPRRMKGHDRAFSAGAHPHYTASCTAIGLGWYFACCACGGPVHVPITVTAHLLRKGMRDFMPSWAPRAASVFPSIARTL